MKKTLFFIFLFFCLKFSLISQTKVNTVQILKPDLENISSKDENWLPGEIQDRLKENLQDYAQFITVVDDSNEKQLKDLQRKSESSMYDENTVIEAGHISSATSAVFTTIRKAGSVYTIGLNYMDLKTGIHETVTSSGRKELEDLFDTPGCAIDELTEKICEKIGINLTATQKYVLEHGRAELTVDQQIAMAQKDSENYEKQMLDLNNQISMLSLSTDLNADDFQKKLEAQKALLEEKQAAAERRMKELNEQQQKKLEDEAKEQERSLEVIKKRDEIEKNASEKAAAVRNLKLDKETVLGKISVIESKKRALVEIRTSVKKRVQEITEEAEKDAARKEEEINSKPYSKAELKDGQPVANAKERRQKQIDSEKEKIYKTANENIIKAQASTEKQENELFKSIHKDYKKIQGKQTVSSLGEELKYSYGPFDAELKAWPVSIYLYCNGILLTEDKVQVKYSEITGKNPPDLATASDKKLADYINEIDMYDSLLSRGSPIIYYEMDYHVEPEPDNKPSTYLFFFDELRVYYTEKTKVISKPELSVKKRERTMSPVYDIRTDERIVKDDIKENKYNYKIAHYSQKAGGGGMSGIYGSVGMSAEEEMVFDLNIKFKFSPYVFGFFGGGMTAVTNDLEKVTDYPGIIYGVTGFGLNWRPFILAYPPSLYARTGIGLGGFELDNCHYIDSDSNGNDKIYETATYFLWQSALGLEIPLTKRFAIFGEGRYDFFLYGGTNISASIGISIINP